MSFLEEFGVAFQAVLSPALVVSTDGRIALTNEPLDTLFGYEPGELVGETIEILVPPDARDGHCELRDAYVELPCSRRMAPGQQLFGLSKDGKLVPVEIRLKQIETDGETYVVASVYDITQRRKEEARTRMAIDAASSAMIMTTSEGEITLVNKRACEMFGYRKKELVGASVEKLLPSRHQRRHEVYRASYSASPKMRSMGEGRDLYARRKDDTEFPVEIGLTPIRDENENLIMATIIDITERKEAERKIRRQNEELSRLNGELAQFAYNASHDLKAPLSTIQGLLACIDEDISEGNFDEVAGNSARACRIAAELSQLIKKILELSRSEGLREPQEAVALHRMGETIRDSLSGVAGQYGVSVDIDIAPGFTVVSQPTRLAQTLENLLENGIRYSDSRKEKRYVRVTARMSEATGKVHIQVADNGIGIPTEAASDVFDKFKRLSNHSESGSGLGLAIARNHVERLNGQIEFASSKQGTTFEITLPAGVSPMTERPEHPNSALMEVD